MSIYEFLERLEKDPFDPELVKMFLTTEEEKDDDRPQAGREKK